MADPAAVGAVRLGAAAAGVALAGLAAWLGWQNLRHPAWWDAWIFWMPVTLLLAALAALCGWVAWRGDDPESRAAMSAAWAGGLLLGGLGFVVGFVGPLVIWPGASLGPLLGILITGPLGFVAGATAGLAWRARRAA
jgi:hypothetical protein